MARLRGPTAPASQRLPRGGALDGVRRIAWRGAPAARHAADAIAAAGAHWGRPGCPGRPRTVERRPYVGRTHAVPAKAGRQFPARPANPRGGTVPNKQACQSRRSTAHGAAVCPRRRLRHAAFGRPRTANDPAPLQIHRTAAARPIRGTASGGAPAEPPAGHRRDAKNERLQSTDDCVPGEEPKGQWEWRCWRAIQQPWGKCDTVPMAAAAMTGVDPCKISVFPPLSQANVAQLWCCPIFVATL